MYLFLSILSTEHNVFKRRLDLDGKPIEDAQKEHHLGAVAKFTNNTKADSKDQKENSTVYCGSCFGAKEGCCNTCNDVREAYRIKTWKFDPRGIEQCREGLGSEVEERALKEGTIFESFFSPRNINKFCFTFPNLGCQIYGYLEVNRVGGSFHIAPGKSFIINHVHVHDVNPFASTDFNLTHHIRHVSFGQQLRDEQGNNQALNPLDDTLAVAEKGAMMFQYCKYTFLLLIITTSLYHKDLFVFQMLKSFQPRILNLMAAFFHRINSVSQDILKLLVLWLEKVECLVFFSLMNSRQ